MGTRRNAYFSFSLFCNTNEDISKINRSEII